MVIGLVVAISMVARLAVLHCNVNGLFAAQASPLGTAATIRSRRGGNPFEQAVNLRQIARA